MREEHKHAATPESRPAASHRPNGDSDASSQFIDDWISQIKSLWAHGAVSIFDLARLVLQARRSLPYGEWAALWQPGLMPFSKRKAEMLVAIGDGLGGLDAHTCAHLPRSWRVLYFLSRLKRVDLLREIESSVIHPKITFKQAQELVARLRGKRTQSEVRPFNVQQRLRHFQDFVQTTFNQWSRAEHALAARALADLLELVGGNGNHVAFRIVPAVAPASMADRGISRLTALLPNGRSHHALSRPHSA